MQARCWPGSGSVPHMSVGHRRLQGKPDIDREIDKRIEGLPSLRTGQDCCRATDSDPGQQHSTYIAGGHSCAGGQPRVTPGPSDPPLPPPRPSAPCRPPCPPPPPPPPPAPLHRPGRASPTWRPLRRGQPGVWQGGGDPPAPTPALDVAAPGLHSGRHRPAWARGWPRLPPRAAAGWQRRCSWLSSRRPCRGPWPSAGPSASSRCFLLATWGLPSSLQPRWRLPYAASAATAGWRP